MPGILPLINNCPRIIHLISRLLLATRCALYIWLRTAPRSYSQLLTHCSTPPEVPAIPRSEQPEQAKCNKDLLRSTGYTAILYFAERCLYHPIASRRQSWESVVSAWRHRNETWVWPCLHCVDSISGSWHSWSLDNTAAMDIQAPARRASKLIQSKSLLKHHEASKDAPSITGRFSRKKSRIQRLESFAAICCYTWPVQ